MSVPERRAMLLFVLLLAFIALNFAVLAVRGALLNDRQGFRAWWRS